MKKIRNKHVVSSLKDIMKEMTVLKNENDNKKAKVTSIESLICNDKKNSNSEMLRKKRRGKLFFGHYLSPGW